MNKQTLKFAVSKADNTAAQIGKSYIIHPAVHFKGIGIKWYEDKPKQQHNNNHG